MHKTDATKRRCFAAIAMFLIGSGQAVADPMGELKRADRREDYAAELRLGLPLAEAGNTEAQIIVGNLYAFGDGVAKNADLAMMWFHRAAEQQNASAEFILGISYGRGQGAPKDLVKGYMWLSLSMATDAHPKQSLMGQCWDLRRIKSQMSAAQVAEGDRAIADWRMQHGVAAPFVSRDCGLVRPDVFDGPRR